MAGRKQDEAGSKRVEADARKICWECGLDLGEENVALTESMHTSTVVGGWITIYMCSTECRDQYRMFTKDGTSEMLH